jgi:hypothetical protein
MAKRKGTSRVPNGNSDSSGQSYPHQSSPVIKVSENAQSAAYLYPLASVDTLVIATAQVRSLIRRAALKPRLPQLLLVFDAVSKAPKGRLRLWNGPGGCLLIHPDDTDSSLAVALMSAFEREGYSNKIQYAQEPFRCGSAQHGRRGSQE